MHVWSRGGRLTVVLVCRLLLFLLETKGVLRKKIFESSDVFGGYCQGSGFAAKHGCAEGRAIMKLDLYKADGL